MIIEPTIKANVGVTKSGIEPFNNEKFETLMAEKEEF